MGDAEAPENLDPTLNMQVERVIDEAFVSGYRVVMLVATAMAGQRDQRRTPDQDQEAERGCRGGAS